MRTGRSKPIFCTTCVGRTFLTSERNDGHEKPFCRGPDYNPDETRPPTGKEEWRAVGSLSTAAMLACPVGSCAYRRTSFGVMADCGVIIR